MTLQLLLIYFFFGMGAIAVFCFLLFTVLYWKWERNESLRMSKAREDIGELTALSQKVRHIVDQQKQLAREFNNDLDNKIQVVKQILEQSLNRNEELYERQRQMTQALDAAALEIQVIQRQIAELDDMIHDDSVADNALAPEIKKTKNRRRVPEVPADAEKARDAFRALLEMKREEEEGAALLAGDGVMEQDYFGEVSDFQDEDGAPLTLRQQIEEYHVAGMSVLDIADKLNISKGEVRLMLNMKEP